MAQELRHETLVGAVVDGTTSSPAEQEFRNRTAGIIHVRGVDYAHMITTAGVNEGAQIEVSKAPVIQMETAASPFFTYPQRIRHATAVALDGNTAINGGKRWGRGQLTLEPNEALFVNITKTSGGTLTTTHTIEYEFA